MSNQPLQAPWLSMDTAPTDGHLVRLLVSFEENSIDDGDEPFATIGQNNFQNDGVDRWQFVGWCWTHDEFTDGQGTPLGWLPMVEDQGTKGDRYRAELYDEVWTKARGMGFPNVTEALTALAQLQSGDAITLDKDAQSILSQCIGAHAFVVAAITKGRPDAALAETRKWVESFREAAETMRHQSGSPAGQNLPQQEADQ